MGRLTPAQLEAIRETGCSLLVSAAAGAGKTTVLAERCVALVCDVAEAQRCDIDQLLVVTFTDAAAEEMRTRIRAALRRRLDERPEDERLQPEKSAQAAAKYLGYLHNKFKDWPLALAAYNAGEGNVQKLLTRYKATTFDRIAVHLPAETQMYVPKVDATVMRREGMTLAKLKQP